MCLTSYLAEINCNFYLIFNKIFGGHKSFFVRPLILCFGLLVTSALGFKARVDHFLHAFSPV